MFDRKRLVRGLAAATFAGLVPLSVLAQPAADPTPLVLDSETGIENGTGITTYVVAFFQDANPANARDMVTRLPGFTFNGGNSSTRGFSGSAGNVLIDGAVASTKSVNLDDILRRIPASNVERIEIIRGGAPGIDMQGFPVVANIIRKSGQITKGALEATPSVNQRGNYQFRGRAEISHRTDHFSFDGSMDTESNAFGGDDGFQSRYDKLGSLRDAGRYFTDGYENNYSADSAAEYRNDLLGIFRANASVSAHKERRDTYYYAIDALGTQTIRPSPSLESSKDYELGVDYEGDIYGTTATLLGLYRRSYPISSSSNLATSTVSGRKTPNGETIARGTLRNEVTSWLTLQAGAEGALNFRDTKSFLTVGGIDQALPNANVRVEERRAEFSGTANITFWPEFRAELGMRYETSVISQIGDTNRDRAFTFGKPRAILTHDLMPNLQARLRIERRVGQLDFGSFAASNDAVLGTVMAGNANLEPERSWDYEGAVEFHFWKGGAVNLTYLHSNIEKINDRILVVTPTAIFDAPGNIGDGVRDRVTLNTTIPFDDLGLDHLRLMLEGTWTWSEVTDPVTSILRGSSNELPFFASFTITQDIPAWNSTLGITGLYEPRRTTYLLRELRQEKTQPRARIYWNWQARPDFLVNFSIENALFKRERLRERTLFTTSRAVMDFNGNEILRTTARPTIRLQLRKTF